MIELPPKTTLTDSQRLHNALLDLEIKQSEREFQMREENARALNAWFRATHPDAPESIKATYGINIIGRKRVCGIRYVE